MRCYEPAGPEAAQGRDGSEVRRAAVAREKIAGLFPASEKKDYLCNVWDFPTADKRVNSVKPKISKR